ncbi:AAA family ATPase [Rhizobium sp. NTR19]|uniref:AAA family ATPase n=1 Tax=Neorhizobium turbinariae TaxID=2937795 RepID=A0ABT0ISK6_9HYPH|nr:AAA family ATPase [Neorhizobium turbinariae]MCK8780850.1 AAA family ATPase [Neorhizobium turbinariae]
MATNLAGRSLSLETAAHACAIRLALRRCGIFLKPVETDRAAALVLPPDADLDGYEAALNHVLKQASLDRHYTVTRVVLGRRGDTYDTEARASVARHPAVIVLVENGASVPAEIRVAMDRIVDVGAVRPRHLVSASREAWNMPISFDHARALCAYPTKILFAALRRSRPVDDVLRRLTTACGEDATAAWEPKIEDLEGYGEAKTWALDLLEDIRGWREGRIRWSDVHAGLLISGPPGTGKTLFAGAVARSCGAAFVETSSAQWQAKGNLGDMLGAMRKSFREAANQAPAILFIDEIDSIGDRRTFRGDYVSYSMQVVNALLELLDGAAGREGVVVIAATNYPQNLDPALRRPGRLDRHIAIGLPDLAARQQMLALHLGGRLEQRSLREIAAATVGYSGADIQQLARDAKRIARKEGRDVSVEDLAEIVPPLAEVPPDDRRAACIHEAGHAIVGIEVKFASLDFVVVARRSGHRDGSQGHVQWRRLKTRNRSHQSYKDELAMILAGMAAEKVILQQAHDGSGGAAGSDLQHASDVATLMLANLGLESLQYAEVASSKELDELRRSDPELRSRVEKLLARSLERASDIIRRRRKDVDALVGLLLEREVVRGDEVMELLGRTTRGDGARSG